MARRLRLKRFGVEHVNHQWAGAFRLRFEVDDPSNSGADPNVFLYLRTPPNPYNHEVLDYFYGVASTVDMSEYPVGEPVETTTYPFYRIDAFEVDLRSTATAEEIAAFTVEEVGHLLAALDRLENLVEVNSYWVGAPLEETGASESSGSSVSG